MGRSSLHSDSGTALGRSITIRAGLARCALVILAAAAPRATAQSVFINEIHYDNTGADDGEAVEIAGPAGTNLSGLSLVLYDGATGLAYDSISFGPGTLPNQKNTGFGTAFILVPGLQDGPADAIALVDVLSVNPVLEFVSYEGDMLALDGPAVSHTSVDIGVSEDDSTPLGYSLARVGGGIEGNEFAWNSGAVPDTFGSINDGQDFVEPLYVQYSYTPSSPTVGENVEFTDLTTGGADAWLWNFGDGTPTSNEQHPVHAFANAGSFNVSLQASRSSDGYSATAIEQITVEAANEGVLASFTFAPAEPVAGQTIEFTDTSTGSPTSFTWDFGDGSQPSSEQNPSHSFAAAGDYEVTLEASKTGSLDATSQIVTVQQGKPPLDANFTFSPPNPTVGENVQFTDTSTGLPTSWRWDFGDGSSVSNEQNPVHAFGEGVFSVTLEVSRDNGEDADINTTTVTVGEEPAQLISIFSFTPEVPAAGEEVQFSDQSTGNPTSWLWSFGDGGESTEPNPTHTFAAPGQYDVVLTVSDEQDLDATILTVQVVGAGLHPDFEITPEAPVAGQVVRFLDRSTGGVTSWAWDFGDGSSSTQREALHVYEEPGAYTVKLDVSGGASSIASTAVASISKRIVIGEATSGVSLLADQGAAREGRDDLVIGVRRGGDLSSSASVRLEIGDGTALRGEDYAAPLSTLLQWSAGDGSTKTVDIDVLDDVEVEDTEAIEVTLVEPQGVTLGAPTEAAVLVLDDDFAVEDAPLPLDDDGAEDPRVVSDPNGTTAVVWHELRGAASRVLASIVDAQGRVLAGPFEVARGATDPSVAWDAFGNIAVTWVEGATPGSATAMAPSVLGRFFSPLGQPQGSPLVLSSGATADDPSPNLAADGGGELVVTWDEPGGPRSRTVDRARQRRPTTAIDAELVEGAARPEVDKLATGDFVAVWRTSTGTGGIKARLFTETGEPKSEPLLIVPNAAADNPAVAIAAASGFVVVWDAPTASQGHDVFGQRFANDGRPLSSPFVVNQLTAGDQRRPRVDGNAVGDFAVVFESQAGGSSLGIPGASSTQGQSVLGRVFDAGGAALGGDVPVASPEGGTEPAKPDVAIDEGDAITVAYEKRGPGDSAEGVATRKVKPRIAAATCDQTSATALCLQGARFQATLSWQDQAGNQGSAQAIPLTSDTGFFWFFDQDNVELVLKVLDGCALNGRFWVFAAGLTDVEAELVVDDVLSGKSQVYYNPLGRGFEPVLDTSAFATCDAVPASFTPAPDAGAKAAIAELASRAAADVATRAGQGAAGSAAASAACVPGEHSLCLGSRFEVRASWRDAAGNSGEGTAVPLTADTGTFWFFDAANVELVVKALQACVLNDRFWLFAGGLTDVEVVLTVTDTTTGAEREYRNPLGQPYETVRDTSAFACP